MSDLDGLTRCVSYVVAKLAYVAITGAVLSAKEVAVRSWLPLFASRTRNPLFDRGSNPDARLLTLPEDVELLLKPTSNFVQAVAHWAEVQVKATDTGISMDNVRNIFEGKKLKLLHECTTNSPILCEVAGLVIACILQQRGLMRLAMKVNSRTFTKIPRPLAFVFRDAYLALRAFAKEPAETSAAATENAIARCKLFLAAHKCRDDAHAPKADGPLRSQSAQSGRKRRGSGPDKAGFIPERSPSAPSRSASDTSDTPAERKIPRWQLLSNFTLALGTLKSSQLQPSISSAQRSSAFAPPTVAVESFVFSNAPVQDLLMALADQEDRCFHRAEGFRAMQSVLATTTKSSPLVLPIALGFFDPCEGEQSGSLLSEFYLGDVPIPGYAKDCEGASMQQMSSMVEAFHAFKSTLTAMLLENAGLDHGVGLLCFDPAVYNAPMTGLLGELQSECTSEDQLTVVSAGVASVLEQLYMCCLQQRTAPDNAQMELLHRLGTCVIVRFTSCLSVALGAVLSFLLLASTDLGLSLPEATWLPMLKQILSLKMQDSVVRRVPTSAHFCGSLFSGGCGRVFEYR
jgi:hypothetical protein